MEFEGNLEEDNALSDESELDLNYDIQEPISSSESDEDGDLNSFNEKNEEDEGIFINEEMVDEINKRESAMYGKKKWQMTGEVLAHQRPLNSLLENDLDFQISIKSPPIHTVLT
jgi:U3 small nucleolar RNA-associated protein MPP10